MVNAACAAVSCASAWPGRSGYAAVRADYRARPLLPPGADLDACGRLRVVQPHGCTTGTHEREVDLLFHALADATRRDIVQRVIDEEQSVSTLARAYEVSFAAIQKHVAVLERARLITKRRRGREQIVHGEIDTLSRAERLLQQYLESLAAAGGPHGRPAARRRGA